MSNQQASASSEESSAPTSPVDPEAPEDESPTSPKASSENSPGTSKTAHYWSSAREFVKDKPILYAFWTAGYFLIHPFRFADEVIQENWTDKMKPLRFLLESYVLCIFLELFVPWMKALTEELTPESLTKTQKVVSETFDKASFVVAFFAAGSLAHLLLGKKRFSYGKAISLFSYCWGAPNLLLAPVGLAAAWIIDPHPGRTVLTLLTAIVELVLGFGLFFYQIAPIAKVYKQNWVKTVGVSVLAIIVFVAVNLIAGSIEEWIVPRLPDLVH